MTLDLVPSWGEVWDQSLISNIFKPTNLSPKEYCAQGVHCAACHKKSLSPSLPSILNRVHAQNPGVLLRLCWVFFAKCKGVYKRTSTKYSLRLIPRVSFESTSSISRIYTRLLLTILSLPIFMPAQKVSSSRSTCTSATGLASWLTSGVDRKTWQPVFSRIPG